MKIIIKENKGPYEQRLFTMGRDFAKSNPERLRLLYKWAKIYKRDKEETVEGIIEDLYEDFANKQWPDWPTKRTDPEWERHYKPFGDGVRSALTSLGE